MTRQVVVEVVGDARKLNQATTEAVKGATTLTGKLQGIGKGMVLGAGIGAFNLLTGAIHGAVGMMGEMRAAYQEDAASQAKLVTSLESNVTNWDRRTDAIEKVIAAQMRLGFSDDEQRSSLAELAGITHDVTEAQELQSLAMDLARFKNMDLGTASDLLGKVYAGNLGTLSRYGIILEDGATSTEALAAIQAMAAGQAEAYADTSLGKEAAAHLKVGEAQERVGEILDKVSSVLIPIAADAITTLVDGFSDFWEATEPVREVLGPVLGTVFEGIRLVIGTVMDTINNVIARVKEAIDWVQKLAAILGPSEEVQGFRQEFRARTGRDPTRPEMDQWKAGTLPGFAEGGIVPGRRGEPMPAIVHGGERIVSNDEQDRGWGTLTIAPGAIVISGAQDPKAVAREVLQELKREVDRQHMSLVGA